MKIGIGLDLTPRISYAEQREVIRAAAGMGYACAWTPAGFGPDAVQACVQWAQAANGVDGTEGDFGTGISVVPVPNWSVPALASVAATAGALTHNRFTLGIGTGSITSPHYREMFGLADVPPIALMRDWLIALRGLVAGERVELAGRAVTLKGVQLDWPLGERPRVPVHLAALGPQMLRLAGSHADGAALNWCSPEQIAWSRERVAEGARKAGRDPNAVEIVEYVRVCVDDDEDAARRAYTRAIMGYAMARPGASKEQGYRAHFGRLGFDAALTELEERRDRGASEDELIDAFPRELLLSVGYFGKAAGAASAFRRLAEGLDTALVRVVPARPGKEAVMQVIEACRPDRWPAA
jgi:alkanesulfonate monooxygenase SsuD/methylene tetrahydromethanopterin reductase-like flavin-dependent oxidoreductase (luciferase family)